MMNTVTSIMNRILHIRRFNMLILDYLKGLLFVIYFLTMIYMIGTAFTKYESAPARLIVGYIIHVVILAIPGIVVQTLKFNWRIFFYYTIVADIICIIISIIFLKKRKIHLFEGSILKFFENYWFIIFITIILVLMVCFQNVSLWENGSADDGYYLVKIFQFPFAKNPYDLQMQTGVHLLQKTFDIRNFSTFEIEDSVYLYLTAIPSTLFARLFLAFINYFIFTCSIYCFAEKVTSILGFNIKKKNLQYFTVITVLLCFNTDVLARNHIIELRDHWIINRFMYFGSALAKSCTLLWTSILLIDNKKPTIKLAIEYAIISFVLLTRSTTALPLLIVSLIVYFLIYFWNSKKAFVFFTVFLFVLSGIIKDNASGLSKHFFDGAGYYNYLSNNTQSFVFIIPLAFILIYLYLKKSHCQIVKSSIFIISIILFFILDPINNITEFSSQYFFVFNRGLASAILLMITYACIIFGCIISTSLLKYKKVYSLRSFFTALLALIIALSSLTLQKGSPRAVLHEGRVFLHNPLFTISTVPNLAKVLDSLQNNQNKPMVSLLPATIWKPYYMDKRVHEGDLNETTPHIASAIRQFVPNIISLTPYWYSVQSDDPIYAKLSKKELASYNEFLTSKNPKTETITKFKNLLDHYPINCIVVWYSESCPYLENFGFKRYKVLKDENVTLYIYYR